MWILNILIFNLCTAFILEIPTGWAFGANTKKKLITLALANVITNPAVVLGRLSLTLFLQEWEKSGIILMELAAVAVEGFIFSKCKIFNRKNPYIISLAINLISFASGEVINLLIK